MISSGSRAGIVVKSPQRPEQSDGREDLQRIARPYRYAERVGSGTKPEFAVGGTPKKHFEMKPKKFFKLG